MSRKIKSQKQLLLFFTRHCFPLVFHNKKHLTIAWQVLWWSQSSFHLIITHMNDLFVCGQVFYFSTCIWPVNNEWICTLLWRKLQLFDVRARCRLLTKTAELCAPPLQLQKRVNFLIFLLEKKWKNTIVRSFRRNYWIYNDFGWYYLCWFIVGFHSFWKNYTTNSEYTSSKVDLFVVWIR